VFAPNNKYCARVTLARRGRGGERLAQDDSDEPTSAERRAAMTWAQRLKRVFNIDIETCPECGGPVQVIACIAAPLVIKQVLHLKHEAEPSEPGALPESRAPPAGQPQGLFD
jgi:hypothetical protein